MILLGAFVVASPACSRAVTPTQVPATASSTVISMQGIDCQSCGTRVVDALEGRAGVYTASFDRLQAELAIQYDAAQVGPEDFIAVVHEHGYTGIEGAGQGEYLPVADFGEGLDVQSIVKNGEAVKLRDFVVPGKVTVFDFYAVWCKPCREVDEHMKDVLSGQDDVALRKLDVVDWDSKLAAKYLQGVAALPYVVVYGTDGKKVAEISGLHLDQLDAAIAKGRR